MTARELRGRGEEDTPVATQRAWPDSERHIRAGIEGMFNHGDMTRTAEWFADDVVLHSPAPGSPVQGRGAVETFISRLRTAFPDLHVTIEDLVTTDGRVLTRCTTRGTHLGDYFGMPPTHRQVAIQEVQVYRVVDGRIAELWVVFDVLGVLQQLGLLPAKGLPRPVVSLLAWRQRRRAARGADTRPGGAGVSRTPGRHPVFARFYNLVMRVEERTGYGAFRDAALAPATGRLVVVGIGPGYDLRHLPPAVTEVVAVEPNPTMRRIAGRRAARAAVPVRIVPGVGEHLPLADASADTVLCSMVLCSVTDAPAVLAEVRRVLRPGGSLLVIEHVRDTGPSRLARWQDALAPTWAWFSGGCRPNVRARELLEAAGFDTSGLRDTRAPTVPLCAPHLMGTTRPRPVPSEPARPAAPA